MRPAPFVHPAPTTVDEAVAVLADLGDEAKVLAGGQSLIPVLALRLAVFEHLVDVGRIAELRGIERQGDTVWIGATTTDATVERSAVAADAVPLLARAMPLVGHFQIRSRGTVGGSVAHADPAAEHPAVVRTLDATVEARSVRSTRRIPAADPFDGLWATTLEPDELLTGVSFPVWTGRTHRDAEPGAGRLQGRGRGWRHRGAGGGRQRRGRRPRTRRGHRHPTAPLPRRHRRLPRVRRVTEMSWRQR
ncbi:MAG TPA: FAD binding domain-containing protein [Acidimicrobiales bacterium]